MTGCGLKRLYVCINQTYEQFDVDNIIRDLKESLKGSGIEVKLVTEDIFQNVIGHSQKVSVLNEDEFIEHSEKTRDDSETLILGDGLYAHIGLGEKYRGNAHFVIYHAEDVDEQYLALVWARTYQKPLVIAGTSRLLMREMTLEDLDELYELYDSVRTCPYIEPLYERAEEEEFSRKYIENMYAFYGYGLWLVFLKDTGKLVARVGIENRVIDGVTRQELGYVVHKDYQHLHIALESCQEAISYGEHMVGLEQIFTCIHAENKPSIALAEKLGFSLYTENVSGMNIYEKKLEPLS